MFVCSPISPTPPPPTPLSPPHPPPAPTQLDCHVCCRPLCGRLRHSGRFLLLTSAPGLSIQPQEELPQTQQKNKYSRNRTNTLQYNSILLVYSPGLPCSVFQPHFHTIHENLEWIRLLCYFLNRNQHLDFPIQSDSTPIFMFDPTAVLQFIAEMLNVPCAHLSSSAFSYELL